MTIEQDENLEKRAPMKKVYDKDIQIQPEFKKFLKI